MSRRACKRKTAEQQKQICEQQKQLAEQQKQTLDYATRLDEYDKKNEEISRKFSTLLQELNKCKTELQYWRSKSPATPPFCTDCGSVITPHPEELQALANQGVMPEGERKNVKKLGINLKFVAVGVVCLNFLKRFYEILDCIKTSGISTYYFLFSSYRMYPRRSFSTSGFINVCLFPSSAL